MADFTITLSYKKAAAKVHMIEGWKPPAGGRIDDLLPPRGITACRAAIGSLQFLASQGMGLIAADTSILASYCNEGTYGLVTKLNKTIRTAHECSAIPNVFRPLNDPIFVTFHDAAWAVRKDGKSQAGFILGMTERRILDGEKAPVSPLMQVSKKCPRVTRSSLGCEIQSASMADEETLFLRLAYTEAMHGKVDLRDLATTLKLTTATLVTDCKGLYDTLTKNVSAGLGADDRRSGIEALALRQSMALSKCTMRWLHSEAQPADGLTKGSNTARALLADFLTRGYWKLTADVTFTSAKKRRAEGRLDILDDGVVRQPYLPEAPADDEGDFWCDVNFADSENEYDGFGDLPVYIMKLTI